jgi:DNA primase
MFDVQKILEDYVKPQKLSKTVQGFKMICPYHTDTHPSFQISLQKGHCKCFSCGTYRDIFSFFIEHEVPFDIAIEFFFQSYAGADREIVAGKDYVLGRKIPKSMLDRGLLESTLKHFRVGYDDFENRITIPMEYKDKVYGVKYRRYPKDFWYSEGFAKDHFLFNYEDTKERTYVEGEVDTMMVWQHGDEEVTGLLGCEIGDAQESMINKHEVINLALDNDIAGWRGAFHIHDRLKMDVDIFVIPFSGKDPGDIKDPAIWKAAKADRRSFLEFEVAFQKRFRKEYGEILSKLQNR